MFCVPQPLEPTQVPPFHHILWKAQDKQKARKEQMEEVREAAVHSATAKTNTDCTDVFNYFELGRQSSTILNYVDYVSSRGKLPVYLHARLGLTTTLSGSCS